MIKSIVQWEIYITVSAIIPKQIALVLITLGLYKNVLDDTHLYSSSIFYLSNTKLKKNSDIFNYISEFYIGIHAVLEADMYYYFHHSLVYIFYLFRYEFEMNLKI